tara:strand:- start:397 stop:879 length:483 start_codon:yes stop_codon:yes gene_type:complete
MALTKVISKGTVLPHFLLNQTSAQSLTNNVSEIGTLDEARHDTHSFADLSNNRAVFTASTAGTYFLTWGAKINDSGGAIARWLIFVTKYDSDDNGDDIMYPETTIAVDDAYSFPTFNAMWTFVAGDYIKLRIYQNSGGSRNTSVSSGDINSFISGLRIGD